MNNKTILQIIKKDLEELRILVEDLEVNEHPEQLLIDITRAKAQTLFQEFSLLKSNDTITPTIQPQPQEIPVIVVPVEVPVQIAEEPLIEEEVEIDPVSEVIPEIEEEPIIEEVHFNETSSIIEEEIEIVVAPSIIEEKILLELEEVPVQPEEVFIEEETPVLEEIQSEEITPEPIPENIETTAIEPIEETPIDVEVIAEIPTVITIETELKETSYSVDDHTNKLLSADNSDSNDKKVFGEQFSKEPSLNDRLGSTKNNESKFRGLPIPNMKSAIGLNDRFLFTRELFGNINAKFEATIEAIDNARTIVEAIEYLEQNYKWKKNETSLKFMELVKRRFEK